jgi:hypothetical protein
MLNLGWKAAVPLLIGVAGANWLGATVNLPFDVMQYPQRVTASAEFIFGGHLMSADERTAYRRHLRSLKTEQERAAFRADHRREMLERAKRWDPEMGRRYQNEAHTPGENQE